MHKLLKQNKRKIITLASSLTILYLLNVFTQIYPLTFFRSRIVDQPSDFKMMAWNIFCRGEKFADSQESIALEILKEDPDLVFLCECAKSRTMALDSILSQRYTRYYKTGSDAALYSKITVENYREVASLNPSKHSLNVIGNITVDGTIITIVGVHLSSSHYHFMKGLSERKQQVEQLSKELSNIKSPVLIIGDFNDIAGSITLLKLQGMGLRNAWWDKGEGYGGTYHGSGMSLRIDHILYNNSLELKSIRKVDSKGLSDHDALVAEFALKRDKHVHKLDSHR